MPRYPVGIMHDTAATRPLFHLPEGIAYLDGNSLGPLAKAVPDRLTALVEEDWAKKLIGGWNAGWNGAGWMAAPAKLGDRIGRLIGAPEGTVVCGDTLSIKVFQALAAALDMRPDRRVVLSDSGNFPSDLYMAEGLIRSLGRGHELRVVAPEDVESAIGEGIAVLMLTEVDYRTGRLHDMASLTARAHAAGALTVWDLAHSAGAIPVNVAGAGADFAVGCTYKYLNGGPGAPAFIYVPKHHQEASQPALQGWLGHAAPFDFDPDYRPDPGIARMRVGTPPMLQMAALDAALEIFEMTSMDALRAQQIALSERFIEALEPTGLALASPRDPLLRGSQVSFRHPNGYAVMQALIADGVVGDFRAPDILRFGFCPLYNDEGDVDRAAASLTLILRDGTWDRPEHRARKTVT